MGTFSDLVRSEQINKQEEEGGKLK